MSKKEFLSNLFFVVFMLMIVVISINGIEIKRNNNIVIITFIINGTLWLMLIIHSIRNQAYSFQIMHWIFNFFFLFFAALVQYLNDDFVYKKYISFSDEHISKTNILLFLWTLSVITGCYIAKNVVVVFTKHTKETSNNYGDNTFIFDYRRLKKVLIILSLLSVLITMFRIREVGISGLFSHATSTIIYGDSGMTSLVASVMRATLYFACAFSIIYYKKTKQLTFIIISGICMLISYFPTGTSRFIAAAIYLGLLLTFSEKIKKGNKFVFVLIGAFLVIWPFLNSYRRVAFEKVDITKSLLYSLKNIPFFWSDGDFDAYSVIMCVEDYVGQNGSTFFSQLLGVLLFFVPRAMWPDKPIGSGALIARNQDFDSSNISAPLPAEGYINLGVSGIILFGIAVGYLIYKIDTKYWNLHKTNIGGMTTMDLIYPVTMVLFFFVSRGDLLSSFSHVASFLFIWMLMIKTVKKNKHA